MGTNNILISAFVVKNSKGALHVSPFPKVGGRKRRTEIVSATDLVLQAPLSHEG
jgi:hypothetical protein